MISILGAIVISPLDLSEYLSLPYNIAVLVPVCKRIFLGISPYLYVLKFDLFAFSESFMVALGFVLNTAYIVMFVISKSPY